MERVTGGDQLYKHEKLEKVGLEQGLTTSREERNLLDRIFLLEVIKKGEQVNSPLKV